MNEQQSDIMTVEELANYLKVTTRTIHNYKDKGLPTLRIGSALRFERTEVMDWLRQQAQERLKEQESK